MTSYLAMPDDETLKTPLAGSDVYTTDQGLVRTEMESGAARQYATRNRPVYTASPAFAINSLLLATLNSFVITAKGRWFNWEVGFSWYGSRAIHVCRFMPGSPIGVQHIGAQSGGDPAQQKFRVTIPVELSAIRNGGYVEPTSGDPVQVGVITDVL